MRFYDFNYAFRTFGGTYTASSNTSAAQYCFDELVYTRWASTGENSDATAAYVERDFQTDRLLDCIFVIETNMKAPWVEYWNGAAWVEPTQILQSAADLTAHRVCFATPITGSKIRIYGEETIVANEEKTINEIMAFEELGAFVIHPADVGVKRVKEQVKHVLDNAKYLIINRGTRWEITLKFTAHLGQADIDLMESIATKDSELYMWINDNQDAIMKQKVAPFRFGNVLKLSVDKGDSPEYYKNLFFSGVDNQIKFIEVS